MPISQVPFAGISNPVDFRNIVINGDMQIAQRSTSVASITTTGYYTVDRWQTAIASLGTWTMSQSTDVPTGQGFANSLKYDCTTADAAPSANDLMYLSTAFEGQNLQYLKKGTANALPLTLSFWVKSTKTGTFIAELFDNNNTRQISKSYTVNTTNTWEFKTVTFAGDTTGAFTNDNGVSLYINFFLGAGTNYTSGTLNTSWASNTNTNRAVGQVNCADSTANDFLITGVQLEAGEQASGFEFMPFDIDLMRCQRYYQFIGGIENAEIANGLSTAATQSEFLIRYMTTMRTAPTIAQSSLIVTDNVGYDLTVNSIAASTFSIYSGRVYFNHNTGATQFRPACLKPLSTSSTSGITLNSEL
jgi:hypothetical protein